MKNPRVVRMAELACPVLTACATGAGDAGSTRALDLQHIARVEQDARQNAKTIFWINPPAHRPEVGVVR